MALGGDDRSIFYLARWIVIFSFGVIGALGLAAIIIGAGDPNATERFRAVKDILSLLLPVIGAWAGTVLAYYFSKENFEAAARTTSTLIQQLTPDERLRSIIATTVMIPIDSAAKLTLSKPTNATTLKKDIIDDILDKQDRNRLPILDEQGRAQYIAHRSTIDQFIVQEVAKPGRSLESLNSQNMLDDGKYKLILENGFGTIQPTSNLADAKVLMDKTPVCPDVFITEDGTRNTKVLGWLTNVQIMEQARV